MTNRTGTISHPHAKCELDADLASNINLKATKFLEEKQKRNTFCDLASEKISHLDHQNSNLKEPIDVTLELMKTLKLYSSKEKKQKATDREKALQSINM